MELADFAIKHIAEVVYVLSLTGRDEDTVVAHLGHPRTAQLVERNVFAGHRGEVVCLFLDPVVIVYLVEDKHHGFVGGVEVLEGLVDHLYLLLEVGVGDVYHVDQQVGFAHLVEGRLEGVYQVGGQLADKSYGIGEQEGEIVYHHLAHRGVERGEQLVLGEHLALCEHVHDSRFAHVGISHKRHTYGASTVLALSAHLLVNLHEP